mmetsp:Transcript_46897/g.95909  ORF Transcript_46897/g.95909 Transcript_46897/m.95909 type:complete len:181 (-) Transcript_46897:371-913(-)
MWEDRENYLVTQRVRDGVPDDSVSDQDAYDVVRIVVRNTEPDTDHDFGPDALATWLSSIDLDLPGGMAMAEHAYVTTLLSCSCQFLLKMRLQCTHILALYDKRQLQEFPDHLIGRFWFKKHESIRVCEAPVLRLASKDWRMSTSDDVGSMTRYQRQELLLGEFRTLALLVRDSKKKTNSL